MQQHVFHDRIGALAVLHHLLEIALQHVREFVDLFPRLVVELGRREHVVQLVDQFRRQRREIVDEVERVLDLVRDAGGELAERSKLLGLHQAVLRGAQVFERKRQFPGALLHLFEQPHVLDGDDGLVGEGLHQFDLALAEWSWLRPPSSSTPSTAPSRISGTASTAL